MDNPNRNFFNSKAKNWDKNVHHNLEKIAFLLRQLGIESEDKVLDLGTGTGILIPFLTKLENISLDALDISEEMLGKAQKKYGHLNNLSFIHGDFLEISLAAAKYDKIICYSVFPHFLDSKKLFQRAHHCLKKDGLFLIAHSESKEEINSRHQDIKHSLLSKKLPPVEDLYKEVQEFAYEIVDSLDNDEYYYLLIKKS